MLKKEDIPVSLLSEQGFRRKVDEFISDGQTLWNELLISVLQKPERFIGQFHLAPTETRLAQTVSLSRGIQFGYLLESITEEILIAEGFKMLSKRLDTSSGILVADQVFTDGKTVFLMEQKVRDDHDSSKKRGQHSNFEKKLKALDELYPAKEIVGILWFADSFFRRNQRFYGESLALCPVQRAKTHLFYGEDLFSKFLKREDLWARLNFYIGRYRSEAGAVEVPSFDTSPEMLGALLNLKKLSYMSAKEIKEKGYKGTVKPLFIKLFSDDPRYIEIRNQLFPTGLNLCRALEEK